MARFALSTRLHAPVDQVWDLLQRPATLQQVSRGLMSFVPRDPPAFPERWPEGEADFRVALRAFGVLPLGQQVIGLRRPAAAPPERVLRDAGHGGLVRVWDHWIHVRPDGAEICLYTDRLEIEAGILTPLVTLWAKGFYAYRQRRLSRLVATLYSS